jgi:hypothetical protein
MIQGSKARKNEGREAEEMDKLRVKIIFQRIETLKRVTVVETKKNQKHIETG